MSETCITCGQRVRVEGKTTHYYVGLEKEENERLREENKRLRKVVEAARNFISGASDFMRAFPDEYYILKGVLKDLEQGGTK